MAKEDDATMRVMMAENEIAKVAAVIGEQYPGLFEGIGQGRGSIVS
jgi:hypothetical protein